MERTHLLQAVNVFIHQLKKKVWIPQNFRLLKVFFSEVVAAPAFPSTGLAPLPCLNPTNAQLKGGKAGEDDTGEEAAPAGKKINGRERLPCTEVAQREREREILFTYLFIYLLYFLFLHNAVKCCISFTQQR